MSDHSKIEWTDATWNPITGCTLVSDGCRHCYAATLAATRLKNHPSRSGLARVNAAGEAKFTGEVRFNQQWLDQPLRWKTPRRIFVCAHGDLFHENVPDEWIDRVFAVMALAPRHTFQVLTKRPGRARAYLSSPARRTASAAIATAMHATGCWAFPDDISLLWPIFNVWLGTSVEDQATADARIPHLLATPAAVRFVSAEPLLGPVDLTDVAAVPVEANPLHEIGLNTLDPSEWTHDTGKPMPRLDWVIVGGESGKHARPMHPDWARALRDQCQAAGVSFFFKQWGEWAPVVAESDEDDCLGPAYPMSGCSDPKSHLSWGQVCVFWQRGEIVEWPRLDAGKDGKWIGARRVGKARSGRLLDGREWNEVPG